MSGRRWSAEELEALRAAYPDGGVAGALVLLGDLGHSRTRAAVAIMASKLGLRKGAPEPPCRGCFMECEPRAGLPMYPCGDELREWAAANRDRPGGYVIEGGLSIGE